MQNRVSFFRRSGWPQRRGALCSRARAGGREGGGKRNSHTGACVSRRPVAAKNKAAKKYSNYFYRYFFPSFSPPRRAGRFLRSSPLTLSLSLAIYTYIYTCRRVSNLFFFRAVRYVFTLSTDRELDSRVRGGREAI